MVLNSILAILATSLWLPLAAAAAAITLPETTPLQQPEAYQQLLVDWIRSGKNGFFHPLVVWKRLGGDGPYAMHATVDLPKGTPLLTVPRSYILDSYKTHDECVTIARMLGERELGDDSAFAPYLSYLFDETTGGTTTGLLPGAWSDPGRDLLRLLLRGRGDPEDGLAPHHVDRPDVFEHCGADFRAEFGDAALADPAARQRVRDAHLFWVSRSWTDKMVPVLDMYNHRNGASLNVESTSAHADGAVVAYAARDVRAGEQLQNSYSECQDHDCDFGEIKYSYDTADIFTDYGFLELYPRRWPMSAGDEGTIAEVDEDLATGKKSFQWIFRTPSEPTVRWMEDHLARLRELEAGFRENVAAHKTSGAGGSHNNIPHEADSLLELFEGYVEVLGMGLEHKSDPVGVSVEQFQIELEEAWRSAEQYAEEL